MSPFSHLLHELRKRRGIRQTDLSKLIGYEQSFISALEVGVKGPPSVEFVQRLSAALKLSQEELNQMLEAIEASQRKLVIDVNSHPEIYKLLHLLRANISRFGPTQIRMINDIVQSTVYGESVQEPTGRLGRRESEEVQM